MTDNNTEAENRAARRWFLAWILGFSLVVAAMDAVFIYIAVHTHSGEVVSDKGASAKARPHFTTPDQSSAERGR